jgi:hypothetical protein
MSEQVRLTHQLIINLQYIWPDGQKINGSDKTLSFLSLNNHTDRIHKKESLQPKPIRSNLKKNTQQELCHSLRREIYNLMNYYTRDKRDKERAETKPETRIRTTKQKLSSPERSMRTRNSSFYMQLETSSGTSQA